MDFEAEYNARAAIPDHPRIFDDWARRSAEVRQRDSVSEDLSYGPGPRQTLDLFPAQDPDAPLVVYLHGGYWQWNDKAGFSFIAPPLVREGVTVAVLNYPLCPDADIPAIAESVRQALGWLWTGAERLRFDRDRMVLAGHSAGAHLAACAMTTDWAARDLPADLIKGALLVSGVYDLRPLVHTTMNDALRLTGETAAQASPIDMQPTMRGRVEVAFGGLESGEFIRQSRDFGATWAARGATIAELDLTDRHHLSVVEDLATPDGRLTRALLDIAKGG